MYNSIILSSSLFGSLYIFTTSLQLLNKSFLERSNNLIIINGLTFIISGSVFLYSIKYGFKNIH